MAHKKDGLERIADPRIERIWEFDSLADYASFTFGRFLGYIIFFGAIILAIWLFA